MSNSAAILEQRSAVSHQSSAVGDRRSTAGIVTLIVLVLVAAAMVIGYVATQQEVTLLLNDHRFVLRTHQATVGSALREAGIELAPEDIVVPEASAALPAGSTITVYRARPVVTEVDGQTREWRTHARTPLEVLQELGTRPKEHDQLMVDGRTWLADQPLPPLAAPTVLFGGLFAQPMASDKPTRIVLRRAVPMYVIDGGLPVMMYTTAATVGEALYAEDILLYLADRVTPDLSTPTSSGLRITIQRSKPITVIADGRTIKTRTMEKTVVRALAQNSLALIDKDYTVPEASAEVRDGMTIKVVRVKEEFVVEDSAIAFETSMHPDPALEIDQQRVEQAGKNGVKKTRIRMVYENGQEVRRVKEEEWVDKAPTTKVIAYGTKIVVREMETPDGPIRYWRTMRVLVTAYTAASSGKKPNNPAYGHTYLGWKATKGVVAVDPQVIPLSSKMYVPGYGFAAAGDIGGGVKGKWIDLCYDEHNYVPWYRWVNIYLLEPVPPADQIRWVLPDYPREKKKRE
jgi:uncharacterized protein YabE (DUF348 family)